MRDFYTISDTPAPSHPDYQHLGHLERWVRYWAARWVRRVGWRTGWEWAWPVFCWLATPWRAPARALSGAGRRPTLAPPAHAPSLAPAPPPPPAPQHSGQGGAQSAGENRSRE